MENKNLTETPAVKNNKEKIKKIKNQLLLRRGGFSIAVTVLFIAAVIVFNMLVGALSERFDLEYDLSADKQSTISEANIDYIKSIKEPIDITVCAGEDGYIQYLVDNAAYLYGVGDVYTDYSDYYQQTIRFINKYADYNDKIKVNYVDFNEYSGYTEFVKIYQKYSTEKKEIACCDIIVSTTTEIEGENVERHKILSFTDVYSIVSDNQGYYSSSSISSNNIENALSNAIDYVIGVDKKAALITGHSGEKAQALYDTYEKLLKDNNFTVERIDDFVITEISSDFDIAVLIQPSIDFQSNELDVLNTFLNNDGNMTKSLIYVAGPSSSNIPNLKEFLSDWGIVVGEGLLFETSGKYCYSGIPSAIYMPAGYTQILLVTENAPITIGTPVDSNIEAEAILPTPETVVVAPVGAASDWNDYTVDDAGTYALIAQSLKKGYTDQGEEVYSGVFAFSSADFVLPKSDMAINDQFVISANDAFAENGVVDMEFEKKTITSTTFIPVEGTSSTIMWVFVVLIPVAMLALAIFVYIRRKNAK